MAKDLVKDFFKRDLSDAELDALQRRLSSESEALRFSTEAERFHKALGAAAIAALALKLMNVGKGGFWTGSGGWGLAAKATAVKMAVAVAGVSIVTAGSVAVYRNYRVQESAPLPAVAEPMAPVLPTQPKPIAAKPEQRGKQVALKLDLQAPAMVSALVVDTEGNVIRDLGTQNMDAGLNRLVWDGYDEQGQVPGPGKYQVLVRWNGKEAGKWVELRSAH